MPGMTIRLQVADQFSHKTAGIFKVQLRMLQSGIPCQSHHQAHLKLHDATQVDEKHFLPSLYPASQLMCSNMEAVATKTHLYVVLINILFY